MSRASVFERADLMAALDDITARVDTYAKDHVSAPDGVHLHLTLALNSAGATIAWWRLEHDIDGVLV